MHLLSRYARPVATAAVALILIVLAVFWPPDPVHVARAVPNPHYQQLLPRDEIIDAEPAVRTGYVKRESTLDTIATGFYLSGLILVFIGSVVVIWHRSRPLTRRLTGRRGRHRLLPGRV